MNSDQQPNPASFFTILRWALWFALVAGLSQSGLLAGAQIVFKRLLWTSRDGVWLAPVADALVFAVVGVGLWLVSRRRSCSSTLGLASGVFLFLTLLGHLLWIPRLHAYAAIFLAAGFATQAARMLQERLDSFERLVGRTLPFLIAVCVGLGVGTSGLRELRARQAETALPTGVNGAPNVLFIVLDTVRAQNLSVYGYDRETTPRLEEFARNGVVFERAFSTAPWTLPSHASFFTGRSPHEVSADWLKPLDGSHRTLAEEFRSHGYRTAGFVANLMYATAESGLDRGFARYSDFPLSIRLMMRESWITRILAKPLDESFENYKLMVRKSAAEVNSEFLKWLKTTPDKPFFAFLNFFDAHAPLRPPPPFDTKFGRDGQRSYLNTAPEKWSPEQTEQARGAYDGAIAYIDNQVGQLMDTLGSKGILQNTLVIITADHGEQFGEHGLFDHGNSLYRPSLHVPLLILFPPKTPAGQRISNAVSLVDLPATILDLTNTGSKEPAIPGRSLAGLWQQPAEWKEMPVLSQISQTINMSNNAPASKADMQSIVLRGMHYIRGAEGHEEMYDIEDDAAEMRDLANLPEYRAAVEAFRRTLQEVLKGGSPNRTTLTLADGVQSPCLPDCKIR